MPYDSADFIVTSYSLPDPRTLTTPRERLEYMRDYLFRLPDREFNMRHPGDINDGKLGYCQSPACISGWTQAVFFRVGDMRGTGEFLGLTPDQSEHLFNPGLRWPKESLANGDSVYNATPSQAARVITHLLNTSTPGTCDGVVDWYIA